MGQDRLNVESRKSRALFSRVIPYSRSFCQNDPTRFQHPTTRRDVDPSALAKGAWNTGFTNDLLELRSAFTRGARKAVGWI